MIPLLGGVAAIAVGPAPLQQAVESEAEASRWALGLRVAHVTKLVRGNLLGNKHGWFEPVPSFEVKGDGASLEIQIRRSTGYENDYVHLWVNPTTALATAINSSCTSYRSEPHLAGCMRVVTDGVLSAIEFEIYDGTRAGFAEAYFGRVDLGEAEACLASDLAETSSEFDRSSRTEIDHPYVVVGGCFPCCVHRPCR